jgi:ATP-binding cassette subfamily C protein
MDGEGALEPACAEWLKSVTQAARCQLVPKPYRTFERDGSIDLGDGEVAVIVGGMKCLALAAGEIAPMGDHENRLTAGALFCLHADGWIVAADGASLQSLSLQECVQQERLLPMLQCMQTSLLRSFIANIDADEIASRIRQTRRGESALAEMRSALRRLAGLLDPDWSATPPAKSTDPVLAACRLAGRETGIEFPDSTSGTDDFSAENRLSDVVRLARVRKRRMALRGEWWKEDAGPLVGFSLDDHAPVALLVRRGKDSSRYLAVDPVTAKSRTVDAGYAATLMPFAYGFFRSLPARRLTLADLIRLGVAGRRRDFAIVLLATGLLGVIGLLSPVALGYLFDQVIPEADQPQLIQLSAGLLGAAVATLCFSLLRAEALLSVESRMEATIQAAVWDRVLTLPVAFFRNYTAGDLAQRVNAVNEIHQQLSGATLSGLLTGLFSVLNLVLLFMYAPMLALLGLALVMVAVLANAVSALLLLADSRILASQHGKLAGQVLEVLSGIAKLRAAAAEARAFTRWADTYRAVREVTLRIRTRQNWMDVFLAAFAVLASVVLFYAVGMPGKSATSMSTGDFIAFIGAFGGFFASFIIFSGTLKDLVNIVPQFERARPILETLPELSTGSADPGDLRGEVVVSNAVFRYRPDGPPVLDGVSIAARPGEFVAVVGPSGSGKSTLLRLLLGFEQPQSGSVYFDGKDLAGLDRQSVRQQIGVVLQSSQLMTGDIYSNIVGTHNLSVADAWEAARLCGLDADIEAMPMGMHTVLAEGASTFSGGQRQRMLIARAIVRRPRILLFDEATSALDNRTQALVSQSLERLKATRIVIAHRLSTIVNADRIIVLERGRVVQSGGYAELMAGPGLFRELAERQLMTKDRVVSGPT